MNLTYNVSLTVVAVALAVASAVVRADDAKATQQKIAPNAAFGATVESKAVRLTDAEMDGIVAGVVAADMFFTTPGTSKFTPGGNSGRANIYMNNGKVCIGVGNFSCFQW